MYFFIYLLTSLDASQLCDRFPFKSADANKFFVFLSSFVTRVNYLGGGDVILAPVVFCNEGGADTTLLIMLRRDAVGSETDYTFSVINTQLGSSLKITIITI